MRKLDKKEEILEATYKHFSRRGYNVSMADIAKEVGIKPPSLYSHFAGKDEIVYAIVQREIVKYNQFLDGVYDLDKDTVMEEKLERIFFTIIRYFQDNDQLRFWRNVLLIDHKGLRERCSELVFSLEMFHVKKIERVFEQSMPQTTSSRDEIEGNALLFLAMIQGVLEGELLCYGSPGKADQFISKTWKAYLNSVLRHLSRR